MTAQEELLEVMADTLCHAGCGTSDECERTASHLLTVLDHAGYVVVKKSAGIHHEREPYVTKEDL